MHFAGNPGSLGEDLAKQERIPSCCAERLKSWSSRPGRGESSYAHRTCGRARIAALKANRYRGHGCTHTLNVHLPGQRSGGLPLRCCPGSDSRSVLPGRRACCAAAADGDFLRDDYFAV